MEDQSLTPSLSRSDMIYEVSYLKRLGIVHKSFLFFYCRDRNHSLLLAKKIRIELNRIYLAEEVKDAVRIITKTSMSSELHGIDIVIADVDHTTVRVLECLNKRAKAAETRRLPCVPVILLMPETIDDDMKANIQQVGGYDVILPSPISPRDLFNSLTDLLYRRTIVESAYNDLRKEQRNLKYPHLQIFEDEKIPLHHLTVDEEDEEEEDDVDDEGNGSNPNAIHPCNSNDSPSEQRFGEEFEDYSGYDLDDQMNPNSLFYEGGDISTPEDYSAELHPPSIVELRNYYSRLKKKRVTNTGSSASQFTNPANMVSFNRVLDPKERQQLDRYIVRTILKENNVDMRDGSDSDEEGTFKLATVSEGSGEKTLARRTALRATEKLPNSGGPAGGFGSGLGGGGVSRNKLLYHSESINIMDESHRPTWKHAATEANEMGGSSDGASTIGADILPFVDRHRPDMTKPVTVAGINKKTALACWKVLHTKDKFGPGYAEHKHDRPWSTTKVQKDLRSQLDGSGTYKLSVMKSMMKPIQRSLPDKSRNVPIPMTSEQPTRYISSTKNKRRFFNELKSTKLRLKTIEKKKEKQTTTQQQQSLASTTSSYSSPSLSSNQTAVKQPPGAPGSGPTAGTVESSLRPQTPTPAIPLVEAEAEAGGAAEVTDVPINPGKVSVIRDWRGYAETDTHDDSGKRTSLIKLSGLLRSAGGIQFGNIITGVKARLKARRLVKDFTSTAKPDPEISKLILINFDNRRIGSGEREHLIQGINLQTNNQLFLAFKSFSKAILVCKQLHLPTCCRGIVQFQRGKFFSAIKDFTEAIKFIESSSDKINLYRLDLSIARFNRGMTYFRLGDDVRGIEDVEYALECDPDNVFIREILILAYRRCNEYLPAIQHCIQLHELQCALKNLESQEKGERREEEMKKRRQLNQRGELMKALEKTVATTADPKGGPPPAVVSHNTATAHPTNTVHMSSTQQQPPPPVGAGRRRNPDIRRVGTPTQRNQGTGPVLPVNTNTSGATSLQSHPLTTSSGARASSPHGHAHAHGRPSSSPLSLINSRLQTSTISSHHTSPHPSTDDLDFISSSLSGGNPGSRRHHRPSAIINRIEITEYSFPSLKDKKNSFIQKKELEERSQESVFLDSFKHANGFKKHLYDSLFIRLTSLQEALITLPSQRNTSQLALISQTLKSFPIFSTHSSHSKLSTSTSSSNSRSLAMAMTDNELNDLSACIEYRTVTSKSTLFYQDDPVDALILVLNGQLQLKLESGQHTEVLGILNSYESYGEISLLFKNKYSQFLENVHRICLDETKEFNVLDDDEPQHKQGQGQGQGQGIWQGQGMGGKGKKSGQSPEREVGEKDNKNKKKDKDKNKDNDNEDEDDEDEDEDSFLEGGHQQQQEQEKEQQQEKQLTKMMTLDKYDRIESYPRSLQPGSFMSCKVSQPSELLLIHSHDFDRMLREQFERQFQERIHLLLSSHLFQNIFSRHEIIRLGRMSLLRHYHQGEVILEQGEKPEFLFFILNGVCKVMKKPDPTESLVRRLSELKEMAMNYDQKYVFHHRLRGTFKPSSASTHASAGGGGGGIGSPSGGRRGGPGGGGTGGGGGGGGVGYKTAAEEERENLSIEIEKLEALVAREKQMEARRQEEEEELKRLGRKLPNKSVHISTLFWPQIFGESCILQPESGASLGTIIAETVCDILCIHRIHLQTFHVHEHLIQRVKDRSVHYPLDEILVQMLESNLNWDEFKKELIGQLPKDKWPKKKML